jgi:RNA polymerase-binding transcription factor DksA
MAPPRPSAKVLEKAGAVVVAGAKDTAKSKPATPSAKARPPKSPPAASAKERTSTPVVTGKKQAPAKPAATKAAPAAKSPAKKQADVREVAPKKPAKAAKNAGKAAEAPPVSAPASPAAAKGRNNAPKAGAASTPDPKAAEKKPKGATKSPSPSVPEEPLPEVKAPVPAPSSRITPRPFIHFTMDDVREYIRTHQGVKLNIYVPGDEKPRPMSAAKRHEAELAARAAMQSTRDVGTASVEDLLGFNPFGADSADYEERQIPAKWLRYYKQLTALRTRCQQGLSIHTEHAIKRADAADEASSGYGQHLGDAGAESFERDFALNLLSGEQTLLAEINEAIERMRRGTYGICEQTRKPIPAARLQAIPYTRYTLEGQREMERMRRVRRGSALASPSIDSGDIIGNIPASPAEAPSAAAINEEI